MSDVQTQGRTRSNAKAIIGDYWSFVDLENSIQYPSVHNAVDTPTHLKLLSRGIPLEHPEQIYKPHQLRFPDSLRTLCFNHLLFSEQIESEDD